MLCRHQFDLLHELGVQRLVKDEVLGDEGRQSDVQGDPLPEAWLCWGGRGPGVRHPQRRKSAALAPTAIPRITPGEFVQDLCWRLRYLARQVLRGERLALKRTRTGRANRRPTTRSCSSHHRRRLCWDPISAAWPARRGMLDMLLLRSEAFRLGRCRVHAG